MFFDVAKKVEGKAFCGPWISGREYNSKSFLMRLQSSFGACMCHPSREASCSALSIFVEQVLR